MLVVSDASPINILVRIGHIDVLPQLFDTVVIPASVVEEMSRAATPSVVRNWVAEHPPWLSVQAPSPSETREISRHRGEQDAIRLAQEIRADAILLDEKRPRANAAALGLLVVGTVGVLERAADRGLVKDLKAVHDRIRQTDFHVDEALLHHSLSRHLAKGAR